MKQIIKYFSCLILGIFLIIPTYAQTWQSHKTQYIQDVSVLASDSLEGRFPGTKGDELAANYINSKFSNLKTKQKLIIQIFEFKAGVKQSYSNFAKFNNQKLVQSVNYITAEFSSNASLKANIVYCGYGFSINNKNIQHNDYQSIDLNNKWAMVFEGNPFPENTGFSHNSENRDKAYTAIDKGASGLILIVDNEKHLIFDSLNLSQLKIPVILITKETADIILKENKTKSDKLQKDYLENKYESFEINSKFEANCNLEPVFGNTQNIYLELKNNASSNYIIIGAHYDHLGFGGKGTGSRHIGEAAIHYGADDNASGVAGMLSLARYISKNIENFNHNFLFVAFGAEEKGLLGSKYFVENLPIPKEKIKAMINLDMIGRMKPENILQIGGVGTTEEFKSIIDDVKTNHKLEIQLSNEGYGPSDHASFYAADIPVLYFTTGAHSDYHTPGDSFEKINFEGIDLCLSFVFDIIKKLDDKNLALNFKEAGPKTQAAGKHGGKNVSLGIMPDVGNTEVQGLRVEAVSPGKPAYIGGMKSGDIIKAIEGKPISDIREYMYRLN
ncbi:MAG: M20/M25/M40 family metallo-hydrolase, partial [Bacteroidales bacterium]|nr:M20/M25/M40 family metallo-hydrolase [Bacteroidales bacterium]